MADETTNVQESAVFEIDGELFDAWGNPAALEDEGVNYNKWAAKDLVAEIDKRNQGRADEDRIVLEGKKKADAVAALEADDKASADEEE